MDTLFQQRASGILVHISSLPGGNGIGDMGVASRNFIDFLATAGQSYWQLLPLGPTSQSFGNSPYMSYSSLAGNPLLISLEDLDQQLCSAKTSLTSTTDIFSEYSVEYQDVISYKNKQLHIAWQLFQQQGETDLLAEFNVNNPWAKEYGLFMALKTFFKGKAWFQWPEELKNRDSNALLEAEQQLAEEINSVIFFQYIFYQQWQRLHAYAKRNNIQIIGDLPIYVGHDSVDVWTHQHVFDLDPVTGNPTHVAGVPPDYFSKTGQRWGNPLYRWNTTDTDIKEKLYSWWEHRLGFWLKAVDVIRIDHFRGFASYWAIAASETTAVNGQWIKGPGREFFMAMEQRLGNLPIIAEDLGIITPEVEKLRDDLGYPGMKILLFAFDGNPANSYLPQNIAANSVIYTGTHDNPTAVGWFLDPEVPIEAKQQAKHYANANNLDASSFHHDTLYLVHSSVARLAVVPLQDILGFGNDCRMNIPGTAKNNWRWRCAARFLTDELARRLHEVTHIFNRTPESASKDNSL